MARGGPKLHHDRRRELGRSFQDGGEHYDRVRPGYPEDSADWLVPAAARDAVDVGAGTGKFTALLVERGLHTVAVDPSPDMLGQLRRALPAGIEVIHSPGFSLDEASAAAAAPRSSAHCWAWWRGVYPCCMNWRPACPTAAGTASMRST